MRTGAVIVATALCACAAQTVTRPGEGLRNAPVNETQGGIVKYYAEGADFVVKARRQDAYDKMAAACRGGPYRIVDERQSVEGAAVFLGAVHGSTYVVITYACGAAVSAAPAPATPAVVGAADPAPHAP